ncbi:N,N-dimethylformamidase beta subunit family domain-containing protein [Ruegeria sp. MALMAid1280]|uniref:N,N-dimethylformamidase beta subunit family domain-containing protein n=1 Tax=Ruegeria sp. MALMAid1280 TaxID=3411634 RepID=UPI003BA13564
MSANDSNYLEIYAYAGAQSYVAGETAKLHVTTTAETFDYTVWRDGPEREVVAEMTGVDGVFTETPLDAYENGCGWPVLAEIPVDPSWRSGVYIVELRAKRGDETQVCEAGFVVRGPKKSKIVFMLTTGTWTAYNCWGGANSYLGIHGEDGVGPGTHLSLDRPFERGFWVAPANYPYLSTKPEQMRYKHERHYTGQPTNGYAIMMGYGWGANSAGWAVDNRPFAVWAEENGYEMEYIDQYDLENVPGVLDGYDCMVIAGHDEYWSWGQRDTLDAFVEQGGKLARFGANMLWQVRMERDGRQQVCYKLGLDNDPVKGDPEKGHLLATLWDHKDVGRPMAQSFSVNGMQGIYATYDGGSPRSSGGFTVYRPGHWVFDDTGLVYGDTFGMEEGIVGYETDAVDYVIEYGLPRPSDVNFPLEGTEILAVTPSMVDQYDAGGPGSAVVSMVLGDDFFATKWADMVEGKTDEDTVKKYRYGSAQIVTAPKGNGEIFCAGTVYWFLGLKWRDRTTEQITHNVLKRFTS